MSILKAFTNNLCISRCAILGMDYCRTFLRASSNSNPRQGESLALHAGSHSPHHHSDELPGSSVRCRVRWSPAVLHLLLRRPDLTLLHHPGELQLRALRWHQAQGEVQPTAVLLGSLRTTWVTFFSGHADFAALKRDCPHLLVCMSPPCCLLAHLLEPSEPSAQTLLCWMQTWITEGCLAAFSGEAFLSLASK